MGLRELIHKWSTPKTDVSKTSMPEISVPKTTFPNEISQQTPARTTDSQPPAHTTNPPPSADTIVSQPQTSMADSQPPEYTPPEPFTRLGIKALDVPQFLWSNAQCQAWLVAFHVDILNLPLEEAEMLARKYKKAGMNLYSQSLGNWQCMFGNSGYEQTIYNYLFSTTRMEGAVPKGMVFNHKKTGSDE